MNISHDTVERDVSRLGGELNAKVRRGERYLKRGEVNQSAYNKALTEASGHMSQAMSEESRESTKQELSLLLLRLKKISSDLHVEQGIESVKSLLNEEGKPRLEEVAQDAKGVDVSHHGRPIWNVFENSMVSLNNTAAAAATDKSALDLLIADLEKL